MPNQRGTVGDSIIVRHEHTTFPGKNGLVGLQREDGGIAEGPHLPPAVGTTMRMRAILKKLQTMLIGEPHGSIHVRRPAPLVDNRDYCEPRLGDDAFSRIEVKTSGAGINIGQKHISPEGKCRAQCGICLLYTSDAADE